MSQTQTSQTTVIEGQTIPVSVFDTIPIELLEKNDPAGIQRLLSASTTPGWFYVELGGSDFGRSILADVPKAYKVSDDYFCGQDKETKEKDVRKDQQPSQDRGYKTSACDETYEMSLDEFQNGTLRLPKVLDDEDETLKRFSKNCQAACMLILARLSDALGLAKGERFEVHHRAGEPSDSGLKLIYEPSLARKADVGDNLHTDSGTMTFLFYDKWGLHAFTPNKGFEYTAPKDGCALINIGDSLQRLSGDRLLSPKHRVSQPVDGAEKRYYLSYFLRPEHATKEQWA